MKLGSAIVEMEYKMDRDELKKDIAIDPDALDVEVIRQTENFFKWAERAGDAKTEAERLENEMEALEARLQINARNDPESFGLKSATDASVKSAVRCSAEYAAAVEAFHAARRGSVRADNAVKAMEMKKRMLELTVTLHGQQYFAGPSVPRNLSAAWASYSQQLTSTATERQRANARRRPLE